MTRTPRKRQGTQQPDPHATQDAPALLVPARHVEHSLPVADCSFCHLERARRVRAVAAIFVVAFAVGLLFVGGWHLFASFGEFFTHSLFR